MIRFLISLLVSFGAAVLGLLVANALLDDMSISGSSFLLAAALFALLMAVLMPFFMVNVRRYAAPAASAVGLITTFVALLVTTAVSDGISISGATTWILATLIVWLGTMIATLLLPLIFAKWLVTENRDRKATA
jgi:cell division protein FtsW (lipid II flippase)